MGLGKIVDSTQGIGSVLGSKRGMRVVVGAVLVPVSMVFVLVLVLEEGDDLCSVPEGKKRSTR